MSVGPPHEGVCPGLAGVVAGVAAEGGGSVVVRHRPLPALLLPLLWRCDVKLRDTWHPPAAGQQLAERRGRGRWAWRPRSARSSTGLRTWRAHSSWPRHGLLTPRYPRPVSRPPPVSLAASTVSGLTAAAPALVSTSDKTATRGGLNTFPQCSGVQCPECSVVPPAAISGQAGVTPPWRHQHTVWSRHQDNAAQLSARIVTVKCCNERWNSRHK